MSVRRQLYETGGIYFITFTCARWLPLFEQTNGYDAVYEWFDYLSQHGHYIVGYVIMPNHVHAMIGFRNGTNINLVIGNGKRFMAYSLVKKLGAQGKDTTLAQLADWVNNTQRLLGKKHEVFEPSFDIKECRNTKFMFQKAEYMHMNPCKALLVSPRRETLRRNEKISHRGLCGSEQNSQLSFSLLLQNSAFTLFLYRKPTD